MYQQLDTTKENVIGYRITVESGICNGVFAFRGIPKDTKPTNIVILDDNIEDINEANDAFNLLRSNTHCVNVNGKSVTKYEMVKIYSITNNKAGLGYEYMKTQNELY